MHNCTPVVSPRATATPLQCSALANAPAPLDNGNTEMPSQHCIGKGRFSCLLTGAVVEMGKGLKTNVSLDAVKIELGYKLKESVAYLHHPLCQPECTIGGLTILITLTGMSPYHFFRDNLRHIVRTAYAYGLVADPFGKSGKAWRPHREGERAWPLRTPVWPHTRPGEPVRVLLWNQHERVALTHAMFNYWAALTSVPLFTSPARRTCMRFESLIVGPSPGSKVDGDLSTGRYLREPLMTGLGLAHCPQPAAEKPRITFMVRLKASHGIAVGRKILNPDAVERALAAHGSVRRASFEEFTLTQQLETMMSTDVLIGVHGAGLSNAMFLPRCGMLIEMWPLGGQIAGPYSDFHGRYMAYHDRYCNATREGRPCDLATMSKDDRGTSRPLMVDTDRLADITRKAADNWRKCIAGLSTKHKQRHIVQIRSRVTPSVGG